MTDKDHCGYVDVPEAMDMREQLARAVEAVLNDGLKIYAPAEEISVSKDGPLVDAILSTLMNPTQEMIEAGNQAAPSPDIEWACAYGGEDGDGCETYVNPFNASAEVWQAMIRAAKGEG